MIKENLKNEISSINGIKRQECEIFSRVVGYFRGVTNWNVGAKAQYDNRKTYVIEGKNGFNKKP